MTVSVSMGRRYMCASVSKPGCEQIIDMFPEPFVIIDRDYCILAANRAYRDHYGFSDEHVIGRHCYEVSHHSTLPCSQHGEHCPLDTVLQTGQPTQVMHIHYGKSGKEEYVQLQATPILSPDGEVMYMGETIHPVNNIVDEQPILIGRSKPMLRLASLLQRVARTPTTVLLLGESGTGKERAAEYIHQYSNCAQGPFVVVDCGTLGENLIEHELFGHEKGAFTGADGRKKGLFETANGGTLLIDEICELPLPLQTKLLRALETGTIRRLGGTEYIKVKVRVIAATNCDIQAMVESGCFRQDLYYRLSAFPVQVPPLREYKDDIPALAEHFLLRSSDGDRHVPLSPEVIEVLLAYDYPGNVRELRNIIERAAILAFGDVLRPEHMVFEGPGTVAEEAATDSAVTEPGPVQHPLLVRREQLDDELVLKALESCAGHRSRAAAMLGVSERTVYRYLKRLSGQTQPKVS
ncbi:MAG: sigma-54 interaction domain-containing protein [Thiogranum sp.]